MNQQKKIIPTLYYYEHCPYCIRVLSFLGLANITVDKVVLLNDDEQTPIEMVGAKMLPILATQPDNFMPESLDIIDYLSETYHYHLAKDEVLRQQVEAFLSAQRITIYRLMMPRCVQLPLQEFKTTAAIDYFVAKKTATIGDFDVAIQHSAEWIHSLVHAMIAATELFEQLSKKLSSEAAIMLFSALYGVFYVKDFPWPPAAKSFMQTMGEAAQQPIFEQVCQAI